MSLSSEISTFFDVAPKESCCCMLDAYDPGFDKELLPLLGFCYINLVDSWENKTKKKNNDSKKHLD